ncbi:hypothetical protein SteCoe_35682 [Stentor coeruleus]|uniref:Uncharacterized protein n=1 Tax=Stentor coeruleus TaxID=5963 RepID=A0A1R2ARS1_9CILI|nr:hypothetical protein SteCoe_35682 [Stentor coeruleus]
MICGFCRDPAEFSCNCTSKSSYVCSKHVGNHYKLIGKHEVNQIGRKKILFNPIMKAKLLDKIFLLKTQAKLDMKKTILHANDLITQINKKLNKINNYMINFIKSCNDTIDYIQNLNEEIEEKEFYCPLESLLIMKEPEVLDQIYGPKIKLYPINGKTIECGISTFPHCIFQYTFRALEFSSENEVICNNGTVETKIKTNFNWAGRLLSVGKKFGIYTGGFPASNSAYIIDLESKSINSLPSLHQKRCFHAMTWIDGFPAVLGGCDGEEDLAVVEVYKNGNWEIYPSLTSKKKCFGAISHFSKTYAFGGNIKTEKGKKRLNHIERYENGKWELLTIKLSSNLSIPGIFLLGTNILIFGGGDNDGKMTKDCYIFDDKFMKICKADFELKEPLYFASLNALTLKGEIHYYGTDLNESCRFINLEFNI